MRMSPPNAKPVVYQPLLVLAYADSRHAVLSCRQLRRLGWQVHLTHDGAEARRLAQALDPALVVLDTDLPDESGWLTCAKLTLERPSQKVILVSPEVTAEGERYAAQAGAMALVPRSDDATALVQEVHGVIRSSAG
jgi:DNA-binding response OmpR family regulator